MFTSPTYPPRTPTFRTITGSQVTIPAGAVEWAFVVASGTAWVNGSDMLPATSFSSSVATLIPITVGVTGGKVALYYSV